MRNTNFALVSRIPAHQVLHRVAASDRRKRGAEGNSTRAGRSTVTRVSVPRSPRPPLDSMTRPRRHWRPANYLSGILFNGETAGPCSRGSRARPAIINLGGAIIGFGRAPKSNEKLNVPVGLLIDAFRIGSRYFPRDRKESSAGCERIIHDACRGARSFSRLVG